MHPSKAVRIACPHPERGRTIFIAAALRGILLAPTSRIVAQRPSCSPATRLGASPPSKLPVLLKRFAAVKRGVTRLRRHTMSACVPTADISLHRGEPPLRARSSCEYLSVRNANTEQAVSGMFHLTLSW
jgi:hypothetical protein